MKALSIIILLIFFSGDLSAVFSSSNNQIEQAFRRLEKKGEVYFKFKISTRSVISDLTNIISIDNVAGNEVYAYASQMEFEKFLQRNIDYEVLTPPGDLLPDPAMYHGVPGEPFEWDKYPTYEAYVAMMEKFQADYPGLCKLVEFGTSVQDRRLLAVKISDSVSKEEAEPEFLYTSTIHGDEVCGYVLMLRLIDYLLSNYGKDPFVTRLVDSIEIWIAPLLNPDGTYKGGNQTVSGSIRCNANNIDLDRNFSRLPGTTGQNPAPEKETQAIVNFMKKHNFVMSADLHAGIEGVAYPWHGLNKNHPDKDWFAFVAKQYADSAQANSPAGYFDDLGGDGFGNAWLELYEVIGTKIDWATYFMHCREVHIELSATKILPESKLNDLWNYNYKSFLNYMEQVLFGIRGRICDYVIGNPIKAKVYIENHDKDSSHIFSKLPKGDFYRPAYPGMYTISISAYGARKATLYNIQLRENEVIILTVKMYTALGGDPSYALASPNGGEIWETGKSYNIIWFYKPADLIEIFKGNSVVESISLPSATFDSYLWNIPPDFPTGSDYRIRINKYDPATSDSYFSIVDQSTSIKHKNSEIENSDQQFSVNYIKETGKIRFRCILHRKSNISIEIYSLRGKLIKSFFEGPHDPGFYYIDWDGKGNSHSKVPNGCYIVRLNYRDKTAAKRFIFSR